MCPPPPHLPCAAPTHPRRAPPRPALPGTLPSSYSSLAALSALRLAGNSLGGVLPSSYASMPSLQLLDVQDNCR